MEIFLQFLYTRRTPYHWFSFCIYYEAYETLDGDTSTLAISPPSYMHPSRSCCDHRPKTRRMQSASRHPDHGGGRQHLCSCTHHKILMPLVYYLINDPIQGRGKQPQISEGWCQVASPAGRRGTGNRVWRTRIPSVALHCTASCCTQVHVYVQQSGLRAGGADPIRWRRWRPFRMLSSPTLSLSVYASMSTCYLSKRSAIN